MKGWRCISTYYVPQHWMEVIGRLHEMSALISGKDSPVPIDRWDLVSHTRHHALCKEKWYRHFDHNFSSSCFFCHYSNICVILVQYLSYSAKSAARFRVLFAHFMFLVPFMHWRQQYLALQIPAVYCVLIFCTNPYSTVFSRFLWGDVLPFRTGLGRAAFA